MRKHCRYIYAVAGSPDVFLIFLDDEDDGLDLLVYLVIHSDTTSSLLLLVLLLLCGNEIPTFEVVCLVVDVELRLKMVLHAGKRLYKRTDCAGIEVTYSAFPLLLPPGSSSSFTLQSK